MSNYISETARARAIKLRDHVTYRCSFSLKFCHAHCCAHKLKKTTCRQTFNAGQIRNEIKIILYRVYYSITRYQFHQLSDCAKCIVNSLQIYRVICCQHLLQSYYHAYAYCDLAFYALLPLFRSNKILLK